MTADRKHTLFHREANRWSIEHGGKVVRIANSHGLVVLAHLTANPGRRFRASDLLPLLKSEARSPSRHTDPEGNPGRAPKGSYRQRFHKARAELKRARERSDKHAIGAAEREMQALARELATVIGLASEKLDRYADRIVADAIGCAIEAVARRNRSLADYLGRSVSTGKSFAYLPDHA